MSSAFVNDEAVYIVGAGAQTAVGRYVLAAAAAVRCGISAFAEHHFMIDKYGEPMVVARAEWLDETLPLGDRVVTLAVDAAKEAMAPLADRFGDVPRRLRVHLALSQDNLPEAAGRQNVADRLAAGIGFKPGSASIEVVADGHAGGIRTIENAYHELLGSEGLLCLVGGSDSYIDADTLETIDFAGRLHSVNYSWGFTPGEGAGFCLLTTGATAWRLGLEPLAELL